MICAGGAIVALVAVTGCGGRGAYELTAPATTTIASPRYAAVVRCTNHGIAAQAKVPARGSGVAVDADGKRSSASLQLTRRADGEVVATCRG